MSSLGHRFCLNFLHNLTSDRESLPRDTPATRESPLPSVVQPLISTNNFTIPHLPDAIPTTSASISNALVSYNPQNLGTPGNSDTPRHWSSFETS